MRPDLCPRPLRILRHMNPAGVLHDLADRATKLFAFLAVHRDDRRIQRIQADPQACGATRRGRDAAAVQEAWMWFLDRQRPDEHFASPRRKALARKRALDDRYALLEQAATV